MVYDTWPVPPLTADIAVPAHTPPVNWKPEILILESTNNDVPANPVDDLLPNKYSVLEVSVVVAEFTEEVAIEAVPVRAPTNVVAVRVFPNAETPEST